MTECLARPYKIPESVLVVIHTAGMEVLLIERADKPGFWQSVTGSKDTPEEPFRETAIREVAEETGIVVSRGIAVSCASENLASSTQFGQEALGRSGLDAAIVDAAHLRDWHLSNIYDIYPVWRHRYAPGVTRNTEHVFGLLVPRDVPIVLSPREHVRFCWLPWREAADRCFSPSNAEAILQLPTYVS